MELSILHQQLLEKRTPQRLIVYVLFLVLNVHFKLATEGSRHILREAIKAGVKRVVNTSTMMAYPPGGPYGVDGMFIIS